MDEQTEEDKTDYDTEDDKLKKINEAIEEATMKIDQYEVELVEKTNTIDELRSKLEEYEKLTCKLNEEFKKNEEELQENFKTHIESIKVEFEEKESIYKEIIVQNEDMIIQLNQKIKIQHDILNDKDIELNDVQESLSHTTRQLEEKCIIITHLEDSIKISKDKVDAWKLKTKDIIKKNEETIQTLKKELETYKKHTDYQSNKEEQLSDENFKLSNKIDQLTFELDNKIKEIEDLKKCIKGLRNDIINYENDAISIKREYTKDLERLEYDFKLYENSLKEQFKNDKNEYILNHEKVLREKEELYEVELKELNDTLKEKEVDMSNKLYTIKQYTDQLIELNTTITTLENTIDSYKNQVKVKDQTIYDLKNVYKTLQLENEVVNKNKQDCEEKIKNYKIKLKEKNEIIEGFEKDPLFTQSTKLIEFSNKQKHYEQEIKTLKDKYKNLANLYNDLLDKKEREDINSEKHLTKLIHKLLITDKKEEKIQLFQSLKPFYQFTEKEIEEVTNKFQYTSWF